MLTKTVVYCTDVLLQCPQL